VIAPASGIEALEMVVLRKLEGLTPTIWGDDERADLARFIPIRAALPDALLRGHRLLDLI
jgi:hypothetical protein